MNWRQIGSVIALVGFLTPSIAFSQATLTPIKDAKSGRTFAFKVEGARTLAAKPGTKVLSAKGLARQNAESFIADNKDVLGVKNPATDLVALPADVDEYGSRQKYLQLHKGVPVYAGELAVHMDRGGVVTYLKTKLANNLPGRTAPKITIENAKIRALRLAKLESQKIKIRASKAELMVLPLGMVLNVPESQTRLAWKVEVNDLRPNHQDEGDLFSATYFLDAQSGRKLFQLSGHMGLNPIPVTRQIKDCAEGTPCQMDQQDPVYASYYHGRSEGMAVRGPYPNPNKPTFYGSRDVDNAYDYVGALHAYYANNLGLVAGPNGQGGTSINFPTLTKALVHNDATGFSPACPYGSEYVVATGNIVFCAKVTTPDVVGHEYSHAVVNQGYSAGSGYPTYYGESGALNEAYADFMGEAFEKYYTGTTDWKDRTANPTPPMALRSLVNPPSIAQYPYGPGAPDRHYSNSFSCDASDLGGVHYNSTVASHAFYLMSEGGEHNGCDVTGQGTDVAQKIFFRGWRTYFSNSPTFSEAYTDLIQACHDLYPIGDTCNQVTNALQAVEMNQGGRCSAYQEVAPACAVRHAGTQNTTYRQRNVTTTYAPNEQIWVSGAGGVPFKNVNIYIQPHAASIATWSAISGTPAASMAVNWDATSRTYVATASAVGQYDVIFDGNQDGFYEPWADSIIPIEVKVPFNNDGACYRGDSYATSENCHDQAADCKCGAGWACINGNWAPANPFYLCYPTYFQGRS